MFAMPAAARCGLLLTCLLALPRQSLATDPCGYPAEQAALSARALQTDLMVSALVCDRRADYNAFMLRFRDTLAAHGSTMRGYFTRLYGRQGEATMNRFVTKLANEASGASNANRALYCRATGTMFDGLASAGTPTLALMLSDPLLAERHGVAACGAAAGAGRISARR